MCRLQRCLHGPFFAAMGLWLAFGRVESGDDDPGGDWVMDEFFVRKAAPGSPLIRSERDWEDLCVDKDRSMGRQHSVCAQCHQRETWLFPVFALAADFRWTFRVFPPRTFRWSWRSGFCLPGKSGTCYLRPVRTPRDPRVYPTPRRNRRMRDWSSTPSINSARLRATTPSRCVRPPDLLVGRRRKAWLSIRSFPRVCEMSLSLCVCVFLCFLVTGSSSV